MAQYHLPIATGGAAEVTAAPEAGIRDFLVATARLATALSFFFADFLAADFNFRFRMAFLCIEVRLVGGISILLLLKMGRIRAHRVSQEAAPYNFSEVQGTFRVTWPRPPVAFKLAALPPYSEVT